MGSRTTLAGGAPVRRRATRPAGMPLAPLPGHAPSERLEPLRHSSLGPPAGRSSSSGPTSASDVLGVAGPKPGVGRQAAAVPAPWEVAPWPPPRNKSPAPMASQVGGLGRPPLPSPVPSLRMPANAGLGPVLGEPGTGDEASFVAADTPRASSRRGAESPGPSMRRGGRPARQGRGEAPGHCSPLRPAIAGDGLQRPAPCLRSSPSQTSAPSAKSGADVRRELTGESPAEDAVADAQAKNAAKCQAVASLQRLFFENVARGEDPNAAAASALLRLAEESRPPAEVLRRPTPRGGGGGGGGGLSGAGSRQAWSSDSQDLQGSVAMLLPA